jgi:hypothetical protein
MQLRDALSQIAEIRQQMARTEVFRGYRSATTAFSGLLALVAAAVQPYVVPDPADRLTPYLVLWVLVAGASLVVVGIEMTLRYRRSSSPLQREVTLLAVEQFVPSLVAGATVTVVIARFAKEIAWTLPGVWAILFSMGIFASRRLLPYALFYSGAAYLLAGLTILATGQGENAFSPWAMGLTFGLGQLFTAALLYWNLERRIESHGEED